MRIAHVADIHWGLGYSGPTPTARFDDICQTMDWTADRIIAERCDIVIVAGDMFRKADIALEKASKEIRACTAWLRKITAAGIEIFIISGTPSHDPLSAYELLKDYQLPKVTIATEPIWYDNDSMEQGFSIVMIPGMDRSNFVSKEEYRGLPAHVVHQMMTDHITETCQQFRNESNYSQSILVSHFTYDLADTGFEDVLMQQEAILTTEAVVGYDLVALGHIHRPQQNGNVFYPGSPERLSFNDEDINTGFWIHEWNGRKFDSSFIDTPARRFVTYKLDEFGVKMVIEGSLCWDWGEDDEEDHGPRPKDAVVRIHYTCSEELNRQLNRRTLEKSLYDAGAYYVSEIKGDVKRSEDRLRDAEITEALGPIEALRKWACNQEIDPAEIDELAAMTGGLMEVDS
jgi:exonuclease SbcD